ncbi:MAG: hypothetical protein ACYC7D_13085 [Nitrososphaerales archaeon]
MAEYRRQTILASSVAVIVALSIGVGVYVMQSQLGAGTTTGVLNNYPTAAQTTNSTLGLELKLSINSATFSPGQGVLVNITEYNTLDRLNNVSVARNWPIGGLTLGPCGVNNPVGAAIFQGYFTSSNISAGSPLSLFASGTYNCPAFLFVRYYVFQPMSDDGSTYVLSGNGTSTFCCGNPPPISGSLNVTSYWDRTNTEHSLSAGVYTVIGGDEWGQLVLLHFVVTQQTTTSLSNNSADQSPCTTAFQNGLNSPFNTTIHVKENSSFQVCVRYFYYNPNATKAFNFTNGHQLAQISGELKNGSFNAASNFTVSSSAGPITFGGKNNQSERTNVVYTITPRQGINGTYEFNFGWLYPSMEACGEDFLLAVGNGLPDYGYVAGCTAPLSNFYPVNSQGFVNGFLLAEIVGVSNATVS